MNFYFQSCLLKLLSKFPLSRRLWAQRQNGCSVKTALPGHQVLMYVIIFLWEFTLDSSSYLVLPALFPWCHLVHWMRCIIFCDAHTPDPWILIISLHHVLIVLGRFCIWCSGTVLFHLGCVVQFLIMSWLRLFESKGSGSLERTEAPKHPGKINTSCM